MRRRQWQRQRRRMVSAVPPSPTAADSGCGGVSGRPLPCHWLCIMIGAVTISIPIESEFANANRAAGRTEFTSHVRALAACVRSGDCLCCQPSQRRHPQATDGGGRCTGSSCWCWHAWPSDSSSSSSGSATATRPSNAAAAATGPTAASGSFQEHHCLHERHERPPDLDPARRPCRVLQGGDCLVAAHADDGVPCIGIHTQPHRNLLRWHCPTTASTATTTTAAAAALHAHPIHAVADAHGSHGTVCSLRVIRGIECIA